MPWQKQFTLPPNTKGMHLVTSDVLHACQEGLKGVDVGIFTLHCLHTSAGLTLNENCDRTVRTDMDMALDTIVPESLPWEHTDEGPDDSVSHLKTSLIGNSVTIPISKGKLVLGTWQGIYLAEFRHSGAGWGGRGSGRKVVATILP
ncbi:secondary thiamine-phosphate synthase enzyme [Cryptococcus amylolentus CBS 6039]|uniref:Secondary thiamine-phosphate synthase enzyme n=2 Tax=Cryptococcus amylolentus TaxID=104669 RepID=A0A1E3I1U7_9TREE|nr:secondary thiamine-phosphate synthase enzyme [Cryptococcus amylolentus CBS 6039]ODN81966.1 secondary thiamine-phosphate synthase enzyme [Cryptococcus amylolentus CBS 6039]